MYTDREDFEGWMERIMERFDRTWRKWWQEIIL